ncbi:hypothetical protein [Pedobacter sp. SYSU D00535]|uniref:hypothetical protein n=1 Tax=Pedobacter sp. SYSU D00535 TaxID=2810308 RepID=UPI001A96DDEE|nr:hypothetical protein [Pedobacter sp. SYSU D00535]
MLRKYSMDEAYESDGAAFNYEYFTELTGLERKKVSEMIRWMEGNHYWVKHKNYSVGNSSNTYKLHPRLEGEFVGVVNFDVDECSLTKKLFAWRSSDTRVGVDKMCRQQLNTMKDSLRLNSEGIAYLENLYPEIKSLSRQEFITNIGIKTAELRRDISLIDIYKNEFYATRGVRGTRLYNSICNVPSRKLDYFKYLSLDGQPLQNTDVCESQLLLLAAKLQSAYKMYSGRTGHEIPADLKRFIQLPQERKCYAELARLIGKTFKSEQERSEFKEEAFGQLVYCPINKKQPTELAKAFKGEYPTAFSLLEKLKGTGKTDYKKLPIAMQAIEAKISVDYVYRTMYKEGRRSILTKHDSIICSNEEDLVRAEELLTDGYQRYSVTPMFKR